MPFITDKQTQDDLNLLGKYQSKSVYSLFNQVKTDGGAKLLEQLFRHPLTDHHAINERAAIFQYFQQKAVAFPFEQDTLAVIQNYLAGSYGNQWSATMQITKLHFLNRIGVREEYALWISGLTTTLDVLRYIKQYLLTLQERNQELPYQRRITEVISLFQEEGFSDLLTVTAPLQGILKLAGYDTMLRTTLHEKIKLILDTVYELDLYIAVAGVAKSRGFGSATALPATSNRIVLSDFRHPAIEKGIGNSLSVDEHNNVVFLTGANMAGKSTLMKSFAICMYLAHMGFPVPASEMEFSVRDGIYSSINVPDNLTQGYSHFYAEVLRVKKVAKEVASGKNLVVIFDELFKGTNVKDAYDATLSVTDAFSENRNCAFIISTHIIEVGEALKGSCDNTQFVYLPTVMKGSVPTYTYQLEAGITSDRHGMMIIENEGILTLLM